MPRTPTTAITFGAGVALLLTLACTPAKDATKSLEPKPVRVLVPGSEFHGVHGITVRDDGQLFVGSVVGAATYQVDADSGKVSMFLPPPSGMADDLEFSPDGTQLAWTSFLLGKVHARTRAADGSEGEIKVLASGLPGANSIAYRADGRLFFTQVFAGDALWEADPNGIEPPRLIGENLGGLNGFDFGADGKLYGPLWFDHRVVSVDVDSGKVTTVADDFGTPAAVNFDSKGRLFVVDTERGEVVRLDLATRGKGGMASKTLVATVDPSIDNLAFSADDRLFITNMAHNAIYEIDPETGSSRTVVEGRLAMPAGLGLWRDGDRETLYLADTFAYRTVDTASGDVDDVILMHAKPGALEYPLSASVNDAHVLLTSWTSGTVQVLDRASGESIELMHGFNAPVAALELADGRIVVAEAGSSSLVLARALAGEQAVSSGDPAPRTTVIAELGLPVDMTHVRGQATKIYLTEAMAGVVSKIDIDTMERTVVVSDLAMPEGLDVLPDGRLVIAEVGLRRLIAVDPVSGEREVLATDLPIGLAGPEGTPPSFVPTGVAVGQSDVFVTSDINNSILAVALPARNHD